MEKHYGHCCTVIFDGYGDANRYADSTIVRCGLEKAAIHPAVTVIGEDVDLIVLLIAVTPSGRNIFLQV